MDVQSIHPLLLGVWFPSLLTFMLLLFHELGGLFTHVANPPFAASHAQIITVTRGHHGHRAGRTKTYHDL